MVGVGARGPREKGAEALVLKELLELYLLHCNSDFLCLFLSSSFNVHRNHKAY